MPRKRFYDKNWDDPKTIARHLAKHPPTLSVVVKLLRDLEAVASTPLHAAWFRQAAVVVDGAALLSEVVD